MEVRIESHRWTRRAPDWIPAVVAGLAASAVLMVLELLWAATLGEQSPWVVSRKVAAIVMGPGVLESADFSVATVAVALATHYALGVFSGVVIGIVIAGFHYETSLGMMLAIGGLFGALVYLVNFHALAQVFPWFADLRSWGTFIGHLIFGMAAALIYKALDRRAEAG